MADAIRIDIDVERMTFDDMIELSEIEDVEGKAGVKFRYMKGLLARFVVDEDGKPLEREAALAALGALPLPQLKTTMEAFKRAVTEGMGGVLPNE